LEQALKNSNEELVNQIALDSVNLIYGRWDCHIGVTENAVTKNLMEDTLDVAADDLVGLTTRNPDSLEGIIKRAPP
jgi:hypothetical protein